MTGPKSTEARRKEILDALIEEVTDQMETDCCYRVVYYKYRDKQEDADGYCNYSQGEQ